VDIAVFSETMKKSTVPLFNGMLISVGESQVAKKKTIQLEYAKERVEKWKCLSPTTSYSREGHRELYNISEKVFQLSMTGLKK
jgi:hypothetical protein